MDCPWILTRFSRISPAETDPSRPVWKEPKRHLRQCFVSEAEGVSSTTLLPAYRSLDWKTGLGELGRCKNSLFLYLWLGLLSKRCWAFSGGWPSEDFLKVCRCCGGSDETTSGKIVEYVVNLVDSPSLLRSRKGKPFKDFQSPWLSRWF